MKDEPLYSSYLEYLNYRINIGMISRSHYNLLKMSRTTFESFKKRYDEDKTFSDKISEVYKIKNRDKKITGNLPVIFLLCLCCCSVWRRLYLFSFLLDYVANIIS